VDKQYKAISRFLYDEEFDVEGEEFDLEGVETFPLGDASPFDDDAEFDVNVFLSSDDAVQGDDSFAKRAMVVLVVALLSTIFVYGVFGGYDLIIERFIVSSTPIPQTIPTGVPAATTVPEVMSIVETVVVTKVVSLPADPVFIEVTVTPKPVVVAAGNPIVVEPLNGRTYNNSIRFSWMGTISSKQRYQVVVCSQNNRAECFRSPYLFDSNWTLDIPAQKYGGWTFEILVVSDNRVVAASDMQMFWFDPFFSK